MQSMHELPIAKVEDATVPLRYAAANIPFTFLWGLPGVGKSTVAQKWFKLHGIEVIPLSLRNMQPEDLAGYPKPNDKTRTMMFYPPHWLWTALTSGKPTVVIIDEANDADPPVLAAAQRLFDYFIYPDKLAAALGVSKLDEKINIHNVHFVLISNPPGVSLNRAALTPALCNRGLHFQLITNPQKYVQFMRRVDRFNEFPFLLNPQKLQIETHEEEFLTRFEYPPIEVAHQNYITAKALISSFLQAQPQYTYQYNPINLAYPTPRSWELCALAMSIHNPLDLEAWSLVASAAVGVEAAAALVAFLQDVRIPPIDEILRNPDILTPLLSPERPDIASAVAGAICEYIKSLNAEDFDAFVQVVYENIVSKFEERFLADVAEKIRKAAAEMALKYNLYRLASKIVKGGKRQ